MKVRADKILTVELPTRDTDLRLDDFVQELEAMKVALGETERLISGRDPSLYFTINRLQKKRPALVELEAESSADDDRVKPQFASRVVRSRLISALEKWPTTRTKRSTNEYTMARCFDPLAVLLH
jgi:hypothetical protein